MKKVPVDIEQLIVLEDVDFRIHYTTSLLAQILAQQRLIYRVLAPVTKIIITFDGLSPGAPSTITDVQSISATVAEFDKANQPVDVDPTNLQWSVSDEAICKVVQNTNGSATFKPMQAGVVKVTVVDTTIGLQSTDTLTINPGPANSIIIQWGKATP